MELQELETFAAAAQNLSFVGASKALGYSQAAITVHIKNLEQELGIRLFDRLGRKISLTQQGEVFYHRTVQILQSLREAKEAVKEEEIPTGTLRIGTIDSICSAIFPNLILAYRRQNPRVTVEITTDTPESLLEKLRQNRLDLVYLLDEPVRMPWITSIMEEAEQILFAAAPGHPLADGKVHHSSELEGMPILLTEKDASYRRVLDQILLKEGRELYSVFECDNTDLLLTMTKAEQGITFLPKYTIEEELGRGELAVVQMEDIDISVCRQILHHKDKWINLEMRTFLALADRYHAGTD